MSEAPLLEIRDLRKGYRRRMVLRGLDLVVRRGEAVAVVGPNGAGKSTLLGCITGDRLPDGGEVRVCGADPFSDPVRAARCMGFVPEQPFLYGELTVGEMLGFVAAARGLPESDAGRERARLLELLGMGGTEELLCRELSQGMGRKVAITVALLHGPRVLVLDEAFNGLDRVSSDRLAEELSARRDRGAAMLLSSHDLAFLARWCDRGLLLAPEQPPVQLDGEAWEGWRGAPSLRAGDDGG